MVFFLNLKLEDCFHLPLDDRAYDQFLQLQSDLGSLSLSPGKEDLRIPGPSFGIYIFILLKTFTRLILLELMFQSLLYGSGKQNV